MTKAQNAPPPSEEVIARYEQILERAPVEGPSFDKLLQIYQEGEGLEKLEARWAPLSTQPGAKGATYSLLRGLLADHMGKTDDARRYLQAATQTQPDDFRGWMALGDFEVRQGKWTAAITALQKGLATQVVGDDRLSLYRKLGQAQERNLDLPAALSTWQKMVEEFPKDQFAVEEAGASELESEQFDEAKKTFQKLVDLTEPNSMNRVQALMRLAEVDDRRGKTEAAVHGYEAILPLTAESSWLNRELRAQIEQVYRREDDLAGLVSYYQKWTQDNPKDVEALLLLSGVLGELGKKTDALEVLRKVTVLAPDRHEVRQTFAQALVEAKQYDEAITVSNALTADDPTEPRYWEILGDALWLKTQPPTPETKKAVLDAWGHIAPPDSKDVFAILVVADLCRDHHLTDEALAGYQRALSVTPDASDIREKEVKLLVDLKREDEAWKLLDQMAEGPLDNVANETKLATLDQQFGRKDAAAAAIQKGLALEPNNFDLLSMEWSRLAEAQKWTDAIALFDRLVAAAPNAYFVDQLEAHHIQALTSAGQLDDTAKRLHAKLGVEPGLTEGELRLLLRIMVQQADSDIPKALEEARRRFPQSVSLIRIEIDYNRHMGNFDAAVAALQRLVETVPQQKANWLGEIVHVRQDQGNLDAALKTAQKIIDASPAGADGYLLYAEIALAAGKADEAVTKLQAAIKLSDKPNDVRQRLARYYLEAGQAAKARAIYDDAFAAAENPQDKLAIVRAMTAAYFQDGQIEELINRFKKEQSSEEGGWKYGLYLSAIDEQMEDYGAARRELAKSLAVRPQDTGLLHSLIGLADKDGDSAELLRYREMLADADPSATNELALANEYASQDKAPDAWRIVQKNMGEIVKDPLAWKDVLNQITDPEYAAKIKGVLEEAIRSKGNSLEGKFALAQFQMQQGDLDGAKGTLWEILSDPLPPVPPPKPSAKSKATNGMASMVSFFQGPMFQRTAQSYMALNEAQQLLASPQARNQMRGRNMARIYNRMGLSMTLDPVAIKDHSLIYLSVIALQQKDADGFLKNLQAKFEAVHLSLSERLISYTLIQAREPLFQAMEEQARSASPDKDLDQFCFLLAEQFGSQNTDDTLRKRLEAVETTLGQRLGKDPKFKGLAASLELNRLSTDQSPEAEAKKKAAVADYLQSIDRKEPEELIGAIQICSQVGEWDEIKKAADDLIATDRNKWPLTLTQQLGYLPLSILTQAATTKEVMPKDVVPVVLDLMQLDYPAAPPRPALASASLNSIYGGYYNQNVFPPPNRYFPVDRVGILEPMYQQLKARDLMPAMYAALDQEEKDFGDWRKIYPTLMRIYFQWWEDKHDEAIASVRKLLDLDSSDDFRLLLASMLALEQKYDEAIPVLDSVTARFGPDYIRTQKELLHVARLAKKNDIGQKAGLRLLSLRLPQQEQMQILDDLREVGLKDKADEIVAKQNGTARGGNPNAAMQADQQILRALENAARSHDTAKVTELAHGILNRDPLATNGNTQNYRNNALEKLKNAGQLASYIQDIEKQLVATPDSARLNYLAAEAYQFLGQPETLAVGLAPLPQWLKLQRTGKKWEAFYSLDGTTWIAAGEATLDLPQKIDIGLLTTCVQGGTPVKATFDQLTLTGKIAPGEPPQPVKSREAADSGPSKSGDTNAVVSPEPPSSAKVPPLNPPWQQVDIGFAATPGTAASGSEGSITLVGGMDPLPDTRDHYVYQTLDGDGSIVARVSDLVAPDDVHKVGAGLMVRESLDPRSRAVSLALCPIEGVLFQTRNTADSGWSGKETYQLPSPIDLKLSRRGNLFTASYSIDGKTWRDVFSNEVPMEAAILAGMICSTNQTQSEPVEWRNVVVTGAAPVTSQAQAGSPTSLPAPWEYVDIGKVSTPGTAEAKGPDFTMHSPQGDSSDYAMDGGYVCQPVQGDAEITAHLESQANRSELSWSGLSFRGAVGDSSSVAVVQFFCTHKGHLSLLVRMDGAERSLRYFKKVAELSPKNVGVLMQVAAALKAVNKPGEAADLYATILKADFPTGMNQYYNVLQAFEDAKRLPEFVKIIEDWPSPPLNPMGGGMGTDMYFMLVQVGHQLESNNHLPEAERVLRKALSVDTFQSKQDGISTLVEILMSENQRDAAAAEIEKSLLDNGNAAATQSPILGFNYQIRMQNNWLQSLGWDQNGNVFAPIIHFLELADELGLSAKLKDELKARMAKNPSPIHGEIDQDWMVSVLISIIGRDPGYRPEVEKMLKDFPASTLAAGSNTNAFLILSQQLAKWPQERPMAMRVAQQVYEGSSTMVNNPYFQNIARLQVVRLSIASGDHKTAQEALRKLAEAQRQQRAINPNQGQPDQELRALRWMIQEGMLKEAGDALADCKTSPQFANNKSYYGPRLDQAEKELAFAKGEDSPVALVYGLAQGVKKSGEKGAGTQFFWQINAGQKEPNNVPYFSNTNWTEQTLVRPTKYRIEITGGPDEEHLTHVATYENVATKGTETIKIPPTVRKVKAVLLATGSSGAPSAPVAAVAVGHLLPIGEPENLLKNPDFQETKSSSGKSEIAGWQGILPVELAQEPGGPLPASGYQTLFSGTQNNNGHEISSERIALQPNTDYVFSGWMKLSGNIGFRFLDADGKVLNPNAFVYGGNDEGWRWVAWILKHTPDHPGQGDILSPKAAFIEIVFKPTESTSIAGLSLRAFHPSPSASQPAAQTGVK